MKSLTQHITEKLRISSDDNHDVVFTIEELLKYKLNGIFKGQINDDDIEEQVTRWGQIKRTDIAFSTTGIDKLTSAKETEQILKEIKVKSPLKREMLGYQTRYLFTDIDTKDFIDIRLDKKRNETGIFMSDRIRKIILELFK